MEVGNEMEIFIALTKYRRCPRGVMVKAMDLQDCSMWVQTLGYILMGEFQFEKTK